MLLPLAFQPAVVVVTVTLKLDGSRVVEQIPVKKEAKDQGKDKLEYTRVIHKLDGSISYER